MPKLDVGLEFNGEIHTDYALRTNNIGDSIDAGADIADGASALAFNVALLARCTLRLGSIPKEQITYDLLRKLDESDYDAMWAELQALKKKPKPVSPPKETSDSQP